MYFVRRGPNRVSMNSFSDSVKQGHNLVNSSLLGNCWRLLNVYVYLSVIGDPASLACRRINAVQVGLVLCYLESGCQVPGLHR